MITSHEPGLGGRTVLTLIKRNRTLRLPWNRLRAGSPVVLTSGNGDGDSIHGVVSSRRNDSIEVSVDEWPDGDRFRVDLSPDEITRKRQQGALRAARDARGRTAAIRRMLLGETEPEFGPPVDCEFTASLNASQEQAVRLSLAAKDLAIIHGPPGTGKTTVTRQIVALLEAAFDLACSVLTPGGCFVG